MGPAPRTKLIYENVDTAPIVYFDIAPAHGVIGGAVQIELAVRILNAVSDGSVETKFITSGRLRCSPAAALIFRTESVVKRKALLHRALVEASLRGTGIENVYAGIADHEASGGSFVHSAA